MNSGSYAQEDISFLLDMIPEGECTELGLQQRLTGEFVPDADYDRLFWSAVERNGERLARDVAALAASVAERVSGEITLVTLVRAGAPTGVLLSRALRIMDRRVSHYAISSVRGRGLDAAALDYILERHNQSSVVFVDGWTGKGFIASELEQSISAYNASRRKHLDASLVVLADLAGVSALAASADDYLIPFSMLLATICGLVSGTFLNPRQAGFDATVFMESLRAQDLSQRFIAEMDVLIRRNLGESRERCHWNEEKRQAAKTVSDRFVQDCIARFGVNRDSVKPGVCEVNRALLTRSVPMLLAVRDDSVLTGDLANVDRLAPKKQLSTIIWPEMPYQAAVLLNPAVVRP